MHHSAVRYAIAFVGASLVSALLFLSMHYLIVAKETLYDTHDSYELIDFVQMAAKKTVPIEKQELPPEPIVKPQPKRLQAFEPQEEVVQQVSQIAPQVPALQMNFSASAPGVAAPIRVAKVDAALAPMVQIKPTYPPRAKRMGIEGYVKVRLNVDSNGLVQRVEIVESKPEGVFEKSVRKSLKRWKFRPKTENGKAVPQQGVLTLKFSLSDAP